MRGIAGFLIGLHIRYLIDLKREGQILTPLLSFLSLKFLFKKLGLGPETSHCRRLSFPQLIQVKGQYCYSTDKCSVLTV